MRCYFCHAWWFNQRLYPRALTFRGKPRKACGKCLKAQGLRRRTRA